MKISKAVITAAGYPHHQLPLQRFVDRDGEEKSALRILIEEIGGAGVSEICVVIRPGSAEAYREAAGPYLQRLSFVEQDAPRGYGDAVLRAAPVVGDEPFLHLVSDHLYISSGTETCARQLVDAAVRNQCAVSAVQPTRESMLPYYGCVGGRRAPHQSGCYLVDEVLEKPNPTQAEQLLMVPGLRAGHYLGFFGMHVLTRQVMDILREQLAALPPGEKLALSPALAALARQERYLAVQLQGSRQNIGVKYGSFLAQLALAIAGKDRAEVLAQLVELVSVQRLGGADSGVAQ
ncbi:MAG: sugar phosphate nucleotidyltransferase [Actinomycetota bacterium]